ncbi:pre-mRNA-splicing factor 18-like [Anneissia japonica]|uniref:pre-mRNA-splicing factor 18-like n=1 Tax=Anneissia japonica TaxID=1529436 RepID=UPI00142584AF|nr:pre-mRNA-splicing factor 18-like [Anneissia japonica]XP_033115493.1 pre-mRNA-splicing factor 18-like [Anneissia japonica]
MDLLKAEIARKRKQLENTNVLDKEKKFFKRGDLMAKQEEEYWKRNKKEKVEEVEDEATTSKVEDEDPNVINLSRNEVVRRLRERDEPIRLFGESDNDSFHRLRRIEILQPEVNKGFRNDFKEALDQLDQQYLDELVQAQGDNVQNKAGDIKVDDDGTTLEDIMKLAEGMGKNDKDLDHEVILKYIKFLLKVWAEVLNQRSSQEKRSTKGKLLSATHSQTKAYLKPLLRKLKKRNVASDILEHLKLITKYLLDRDYVKANDAYLQMAIGNAPWPIGVTMVGIHARTGREKIYAQHVAHVLNDETQRKYIQGLKRLMTLCQRQYPTDPSRCVEYNA